MKETLLLTIESTGQAGEDLLVFPGLSSDKYEFRSDMEKIKIVTPDGIVIEKNAEFSIPFDVPSRPYWMLIPNTKKSEIPIGSRIWIMKPLDQISKQT